MNLKELLGEELALQVEAKLGDTKLVIGNNGSWLPKETLNEKIETIKKLEKQISERDEQLGVLKQSAEGNDKLLAKINELESANEKTRAEYEQKIKDTQLSTAMKIALNGKVLDFDIVSSLIKKDEIELDENGNIIKGLEEQVTTLKENKSFLFVPEVIENKVEEPTPQAKIQTSAGNPNVGDVKDDPFLDALKRHGIKS